MNLKSLFFLFLAALLIGTSCSDDDPGNEYKTYQVSVKLVYPDGYDVSENVTVTLTSTGSTTTYQDSTDASGIATFAVPVGVYQASVTDKRSVGGSLMLLNGSGSLTVVENYADTTPVELNLTASKSGSIVIKELYVGGCQKDDGSGKFQRDPYVILYNNSEGDIALENVALGMTTPYNMSTANKYYTDGKLSYEAEGWIPAGMAIWYFQQTVTIPAGKQIVIALQNAVDNTVTYKNSINFANAEYYCTYDVSGQLTNTLYYPAPSSVIPTDHHLKATAYGAGNGWPLSTVSPAFFLFSTRGSTPAAYASDATNLNNYPGSSSLINLKVPVDWVIDGIEVKGQGVEGYKRLTSAIDAGFVTMINGFGYTLYRNVDKTATEALEENKGKLVYNYSLGTTDQQDGSTDPSTIDAEASIKNGARIIYVDTNNSTNDFHQRSKASLRN